LSQMESFSKWGIMTDFRYSYLTMQPLYESNVLDKFADLVQKGGVIARG
jgi:isoleucyl-tRNA synthetase